MKLKKKKKAKRMRGTGTHGWGARKKHQGSGHRGGVGMAGTGKRADHKKSLIINLYGTKYFGKQGETSKSTKKRTNKVRNLRYISDNIESLKKDKYGVIELADFKILGDGEIKSKFRIRARAASQSAIKKIGDAGGEIILPKREVSGKAEKSGAGKGKKADSEEDAKED